jgi:hypothetical protein
MVPSVFTPQMYMFPTLTEAKEVLVEGDSNSPQHTTVPSISTPHAPPSPALIDAKAPVGGAQGNPQHARVSSVFIPQAQEPLTLTAMNEPSGGDRLGQHATVPSGLMPQAFSTPALTEPKAPVGGVVSPPKLLPQHAMELSVLIPQAN